MTKEERAIRELAQQNKMNALSIHIVIHYLKELYDDLNSCNFDSKLASLKKDIEFKNVLKLSKQDGYRNIVDMGVTMWIENHGQDEAPSWRDVNSKEYEFLLAPHSKIKTLFE